MGGAITFCVTQKFGLYARRLSPHPPSVSFGGVAGDKTSNQQPCMVTTTIDNRGERGLATQWNFFRDPRCGQATHAHGTLQFWNHYPAGRNLLFAPAGLEKLRNVLRRCWNCASCGKRMRQLKSSLQNSPHCCGL